MSCNWEPCCSLESLQLRAQLLARVRAFFFARGVLEVETPILCHSVGTDPNLDFFSCSNSSPSSNQTLHLQTSPEFAMKRLLASGSGSIFQICKAFRQGESGRYHNPEFTLLEWYRVGYDLSHLMDELDELIRHVCASSISLGATQRVSYQHVFQYHTGLDPLKFSLSDYLSCAKEHQLADAETVCGNDYEFWLNYLFSLLVQPHLGSEGLCLVYDYPACQSSLARRSSHNHLLVERFEVFLQGIELGNGYYELLDVEEQRIRFNNENQLRQSKGKPQVRLDERYLSALNAGLPDCSGIAVGLDRILMLVSARADINQVLSFPISCA